MEDYNNFLATKKTIAESTGFDVTHINPILFPFQRDITKWALKKGKACIFAGTGLGKTFQQLEWAKHVCYHENGNVLIVAPLAVARQTVSEGEKIDVGVTLCRTQNDVKKGANITNYDMLHHFDVNAFCGVVLDESSILKAFSGKVRTQIIDMFRDTPYKLACTATPAPNDHMELGNHAEFMGVLTRTEMLSMFFVHDGKDTSQWRLKRHSVSSFWEWVASWAVMLRLPHDLGYTDNGFALPALHINQNVVDKTAFYVKKASTLTERRDARRNSMVKRIDAATRLINNSDETWLVWCDLNDESSMLTKRISDAVEIKGADDREYKTEKMIEFANGDIRVLVTKPSIAGFGMNFQVCNNMAFVGLSDSFEQYYQAVRRCWRFGQENEVNVHIFTSEKEGEVVKNIKRKEKDYETMLKGMIASTQEITKENVSGTKAEKTVYSTSHEKGDKWDIYLEDNVEHTRGMSDNSVDYILYSPPFSSLYTYSDSERDMGNSKGDNEFFTHFSFLAMELHRILQPGRLMSVHCMNLPTSLTHNGYIGIKDFRGDLIRLFQSIGFIYHSEVCIWKDPVIAATRTKALGLLYKQLKKDSCRSRMGIPDYILTFRKKGENTKMVSHTEKEFPCSIWQRYASPVWFDINQTHTLQHISARAEKDEKHICPLQLDVIQRCLEMWSNPDDLVYDPFAGIGSTIYQAVIMGRRGIGCELKQSYYDQAVKNMKTAEYKSKVPPQVGFDYFGKCDEENREGCAKCQTN